MSNRTPEEGQGAVRQWLVRRSGRIEGPYSREVLAREVILGRLGLDDEVSSDGEFWRTLGRAPQLILDYLVGAGDDPVARQRLTAACRWEEMLERHAPRTEDAVPRERPFAPAAPRFRPETERQRDMNSGARRRHRFIAGVVAAGILAGLLTILYVYGPTNDEAQFEVAPVNCGAAPAPGVNWSDCQLEGAELGGANLIGARLRGANLGSANLTGSQLVNADLSYASLNVAKLGSADLRAASLVGATLRGADLSGANLGGTNLSYADLSGANLSGANLEGVQFDNAVWIDGGKCAAESIGQCMSGGR